MDFVFVDVISLRISIDILSMAIFCVPCILHVAYCAFSMNNIEMCAAHCIRAKWNAFLNLTLNYDYLWVRLLNQTVVYNWIFCINFPFISINICFYWFGCVLVYFSCFFCYHFNAMQMFICLYIFLFTIWSTLVLSREWETREQKHTNQKKEKKNRLKFRFVVNNK